MFKGVPKKLPTGFKLIKGWLLGPKVKITGGDLSRVNLSGVDLRGSKINALFKYANLSKANLSSSNLEFMNLEGANLTSANLSYSSCGTGCIFDRATLNGANLTGFKFGYSSMKGIKASFIVGRPSSLPYGYCFVAKSIKTC
jgi:uncharacterized protein YjbI with pentapeptide repeats